MTAALAPRPPDAVVLAEAVPTNPALVYLASLPSPGSRRVQERCLETIARLALGVDMTAPGAYCATFPWHQLRAEHTTALRAKLADLYPAPTANRHLSALRRVLKEAWRLGLLDAETYQRTVDVRNIAGETVKQAEKGRHLQPVELALLLGACFNDPHRAAGRRDAALLALAYATGLRRAELAGLQVAHIDLAAKKLLVQRGKGRKDRVVPLDAAGLGEVLADWLAVRGPQPGPLFYRIRKGDVMTADGITQQAVYEIARKRAAEAGLARFAPHDFRRTFAGDLLDAGADLSTVQKLMGHANTTTTSGYDRRGERAKRNAVAKLAVPYRRPEG